METENLFEIYENVKQLTETHKNIVRNDYDLDECIKFLNLIQYHKPLFDIEKYLEYEENVIYSASRYLGYITERIISCFRINICHQFPKEIYEAYYNYPHWKVRYYIANNDYTPREILENMSQIKI